MSDPTSRPSHDSHGDDPPADGTVRTDTTVSHGIVSEQNATRLTNSGIFHPARSPVFDRVVDQARRIFDCNSSMLTIIDEENDRQFFKAESGLLADPNEARETALAYSFCKIVVQNSAPLVITDARTDPRVSRNEAVALFDIVAYLGVPIKDETGQAVAALCLVDPEPRPWTSANIEVLQAFAEGVSSQIMAMFRSDTPQSGHDGTLLDPPFRIGKMSGALLTYHHSADGTEQIESASAEAQDIWGISGADYVDTFRDVFAMCLVEDYPLARASLGVSAGGMIPWHHKWRIRTHQNELKCLEGHGLPVPAPGGGVAWRCTISDVTPAV